MISTRTLRGEREREREKEKERGRDTMLAKKHPARTKILCLLILKLAKTLNSHEKAMLLN